MVHHFECSIDIWISHLSKRLSDLKQNGTQKWHHFLEQFSIPFHKLWSVLLQVVAQKKHFLTGWDNWTANQKLLFNNLNNLLKLPLATKWNTSCKRVWKIVSENSFFSCLPFCLRSLGRLEKCDFMRKTKI